jgi:hypothetical protein
LYFRNKVRYLQSPLKRSVIEKRKSYIETTGK